MIIKRVNGIFFCGDKLEQYKYFSFFRVYASKSIKKELRQSNENMRISYKISKHIITYII